MPLRLLEAQSCGLPIVGSRIPGISDVVIEGVTGYLVRMRDVNEFVTSIIKYYELWRDSPKEYYELNKKIREYIRRNYDWSIIIPKLEKMFETLYYTPSK